MYPQPLWLLVPTSGIISMSRTFGIPVTEVLASLRASLDSLAGVHPGQLLDTDLTTAVIEIETLSRRLAGAQLAVIAEGISRGLPFATGSGTGQGPRPVGPVDDRGHPRAGIGARQAGPSPVRGSRDRPGRPSTSRGVGTDPRRRPGRRDQPRPRPDDHHRDDHRDDHPEPTNHPRPG